MSCFARFDFRMAKRSSTFRQERTQARHPLCEAAWHSTARSTTKCWESISRQRKVDWRYEHPQRKFPFYSSAAVTSARVVVGGRDKMVHGLTMQGKAAWTFATRARVESSPAIADGRVFVGSNDGRFYVLSLSTGAKLWEFNAGAPLSASPAIANGRIVIGSQDGRLYCFG